MNKQTMSFAAALEFKPEHPERTARHSLHSFDVVFQTWPNRSSMAKSIRMQQRREAHYTDWRAIVPLTDGEGY